LIIRFRFFFIGRGFFKSLLFFFSVITIFIAGLGALFEIDIKKIIALSTLRQLGIIIIILSLGFLNLSFFHLLTHALFKAILFLCAGVFIHGINSFQDIRYIGLLYKISPSLRIIIGLASLSLSGFPFLRGFFSKDIILEFSYFTNGRIFIILLILVATLLTGLYSLRLIYYRI
jgi:NADH-ubiquinone oxidoreductase chain 5